MDKKNGKTKLISDTAVPIIKGLGIPIHRAEEIVEIFRGGMNKRANLGDILNDCYTICETDGELLLIGIMAGTAQAEITAMELAGKKPPNIITPYSDTKVKH